MFLAFFNFLMFFIFNR